MARKPTGSVIEHTTKAGTTTYGLRFTACGKRRFVSLGAVSRAQAEDELRYVLSQVERGNWQPPVAITSPAEPSPVPTFHVFASEWFERIRPELAPSTQALYRTLLSVHLLPAFATRTLTEITVEAVDRYRANKVRADKLSAETINKTLKLLAQILEDAVEYGHIDRNPAKGKRRRLKVSKVARSHLDRVEQIEALLAAATALDGNARADRQHVPRRTMLATLTFWR